jgi:hypothetical protein
MGASSSDACFGDSCNCYGDPQAENANAGCSKCMPDVVCDDLAERAAACGVAVHGNLATCESRVSAEHTCIENAGTLACDAIANTCPTGDVACLSELLTGASSSDGESVTTCDIDAACGPLSECFGHACNPPLGTPCAENRECGSFECRGGLCQKPCISSCEPGSFCGCPATLSCIDGFCA